ncbi:MAG: TonB-dependent receptor, partial [Acidobacteria bacterium]|nr:TonB-dependent receptor [Acidobacteriota bacterium]
MTKSLASRWARGGLALFAFLFCASLAQAQLTRGTIAGTVTDQSGAAVPGAAITITHVDTGIARQAETGATGRYEAPNLSVGSYEVSATLAGFQTSIRAGITLSIGQTAVVDFVLQVGEVTQAVTVTGEVTFVETTSATVSNLVTVQKVEDLPLNNRDLTQLTFLQPGVLRVPSSGDLSEFSGMGDKLTVAGARGTHNLYLLDGVSNGDLSGNAQGASGAYIGAETVAELQVITNNYSAEYQSAAGAIVSAITKSGTNSLHGSLFEFIRNDNVDAANFFTNAFGEDKPEFKRNQFGGSLGGPIVSDRTFFFGSYEGLRERLNTTDTARVLSTEVHQGFVGGEFIGIAPEVAPYLALYPIPGQGNTLVEDFGDGTSDVAGPASTPTRDDFASIKVDHNISDNNQMSATYNFDDAEHNGPFSILGEVNNAAGTGGAVTSLRHIFGFGLTSILSPTTLNEFHFGFSHTVSAGDIALASRRDWGDLTFGADRSGEESVSQGVENFFGQINPGDASAIGFRTGGSNYLQQSLSFKDGLSFSRGNHSLRAGVEVIRFHYDQRSCSRGCYGIYDFDTVEDFLTASPFRFQGMVPDEQGLGLSPPHIMQQYQFGAYFQDNWQIANSLTLNLGFRYEFVTVPSGDEARLAALINFGDADTVVGPPYTNATKKSFSPRFGFAWAPGDRKTSLRGGFGIFYVHPRLYQIRTSLQELPPFVQVRRIDDDDLQDDFGVSLEFPTAFQNQIDLGEQRNNLRALEFNQKTAYVYRWSLTLQREVADWVLSAGYTGSRALHLLNQNRMNLRKWDGWPDQPPAGTPKQWSTRRGRIQCCFGEARIQTSNGNTFYHGLALGAQKRLSRGLQVQMSYNFSKNIDQ